MEGGEDPGLDPGSRPLGPAGINEDSLEAEGAGALAGRTPPRTAHAQGCPRRLPAPEQTPSSALCAAARSTPFASVSSQSGSPAPSRGTSRGTLQLPLT